ncbi:uncharacterized protein LOC125025227 [Penaeus chinensis]|uniref:uncharacterized protein LOC125025227 n=1 Tax=Penaeus chinensis TaxID=139456 RepID=UPI001FB7ADAF|nr:uncharacterized protein LOC125025227 [Penaeus chinensis]
MASLLLKNNLGLMKWPFSLCNFSLEHRISRIKVSLCLVQKVNRKSTGILSHVSNSFQQHFASEMRPHRPVMSKEVIEYLAPKENQIFLDMTYGAGGHSRKILEKSPKVKVLCLDRDPLACDLAKKLQEEYPGRVIPLLGKFSELPKLLANIKVPKNSLNGVLINAQFDHITVTEVTNYIQHRHILLPENTIRLNTLSEDNPLSTPIIPEEIVNTIKRTKNTAPGESNISKTVIEHLPLRMISRLCHIFNAALTTNINTFEHHWKTIINKFKLIPIAHRNSQPITANNTNIPYTRIGNILRFHFTTTGFTSHITQRITQAHTALIKLRRFSCCTLQTKLRLYKTSVRPIHEYTPGPLIAISNSQKLKMQSVKNKALLWLHSQHHRHTHKPHLVTQNMNIHTKHNTSSDSYGNGSVKLPAAQSQGAHIITLDQRQTGTRVVCENKQQQHLEQDHKLCKPARVLICYQPKEQLLAKDMYSPHPDFIKAPLWVLFSSLSRNSGQITAASILQHIDEDSLYKVLKFYGEEKNSRKIARALVESRYMFRKLDTTKELAELVMSVVGQEYRLDKLQRPSHPATKTFQALRILVNNELNELDYGLRLAHYYLQPGASLVAISFHSLEDTIIKRHITGMDIDKTPLSIGSGVGKHRSSLSTYSAVEMENMMKKPWAPLDKHVILPSEREVQKNPRSRSAKLRAARKC